MIIRLLAALLLFSTDAAAQSSAAFDPDCYIPNIDNPNELDTIYGFKSNQRLGDNLYRIGDRIFLSGLPTAIPFWTAFDARPVVDIHNLKVTAKLSFTPQAIIHRGHFRNSRNFDLLVYKEVHRYRIYWSDENGLYDSNNYSILRKRPGNFYKEDFANFDPYCAKLTSDSVEDIVVGVGGYSSDNTRDTAFLTLFRGGETLYRKGDTAYADDVLAYEHTVFDNYLNYSRNVSQGDWRGTGRIDAIGLSPNNTAFYFRNDPPFTLGKLVQAMRNDTLWTGNNPKWDDRIQPRQFSMRAFRKEPSDTSLDFMPLIPSAEPRDGGFAIFKGGPDFGNARLKIDSPSAMIYHPVRYDSRFQIWFAGPQDCGDMSGTGNNVLGMGGSAIDGLMTFGYVLGNALDDKADLFYPMGRETGGFPDTVAANDDLLTDVILGMPGYVAEMDEGRKEKVGAVHVIYGSNKIPAKKARILSHNRKSSLSASLDLTSQTLTIKCDERMTSDPTLILRDVLGRIVLMQKLQSVQGVARIDISYLSAGSYFLELSDGALRSTTKVSVVR